MNQTANETLIREVIEEVLGRLNQNGNSTISTAASVTPTRTQRSGKHYGVFPDADSACEAAADAFQQLSRQGIAGRRIVVDIVKTLCEQNAEEWGRIELEETRIGRLDHKIGKLQIIKLVPGVEFINPYALSGDHGITLEEYTPFGVIGAVTPSTHSIPTLAGNVVNMVAGGNAVVFNAHPAASKCAAMATRVFNKAIEQQIGIENLICIVEEPTLESFDAICANDHVRLLCVTGGPGVVAAAMKTGKRAICAGPGNPPVLVDDTACMKRAAQCIVEGAAFDNNLLCIGEKEVFVLDKVADKLTEALAAQGAVRLSVSQVDRLSKEVFSFEQGKGAGCPDPILNRDFVGKDASVLARVAGVSGAEKSELLFAETDGDNVFVAEEQMMPFIPIVRVNSVEEGVRAAKQAEHGYRHTSIIHSNDVNHMTQMARALDTTLFIKNGPSMAGLGLGGEGYLSFSIATPTGEGISNPKTFTRVRRCVMVDNLKIY